MTERLTTLAALKDWLDITTDDSDVPLTRLIDAASQFVLNYISRDSFGARTFTQNFKGNGKTSQLLKNWPILSITSVGINGNSVNAANIGNGGLPTNGYLISDERAAPQALELYGSAFYYGAYSQVVYEAGYRTVQDVRIPDAPTDPASDYATVTTSLGGQWTEDIRVQIDGVTATRVDENPAAGEYSVDAWGTYTFNATADHGKLASIYFNYCPADVAQATLELISEWYRRKDRIGLLSKTLGGQETVTFSQKDMNDSIRGTLQYYMNVVPI